jgi:hypothetical protein
MDRIIAGEAALIPGYSGLRELSLEPEYELYMKLNSMQLWKTRAVRLKSLPIFKNATKPLPSEKLHQFVHDLKVRLNRNEMPKIIFSALIPSKTILGLNTDIHVVLANKLETLENGNIRIHVWDINFYAETLIREPKYIEITPEQQIHYAPWYDPSAREPLKSDLVARVEFTPENDAETAKILRSLAKFCKEHPNYCINRL